MKTIEILRIELLKDKYRIHFRITPESALIRQEVLEVCYFQKFRKEPFYPLMIALAFLLPLSAQEAQGIILRTGFVLPETILDYWRRILSRLKLTDLKLQATPLKGAGYLRIPRPKNAMGRVALLLGGGVESNFALSLLHPLQVDLISITGWGWMNNNTASGHFGIKQQIEKNMMQDQKVTILSVNTNARSLLQADDLVFNRYISGLLFYYLSLPLCAQRKVHLLCKSSELEEALNFIDHDLCLHPMTVPYITFPGQTLFLPMFNAFPKISMLQELKSTPFLQYIYSCFMNTDKRWCGTCSKCGRISAFCDRLGISKASIGMQEGIPTVRETGEVTKKFWENMDLLFPEKKTREAKDHSK